MAVKDSEVKRSKPRPPPSPKQRAVLLYGQRLRGLGNVSELIKHLDQLGESDVASNVRIAVYRLQIKAQQEYEAKRRELDPEWRSEMQKFIDANEVF